MATHNKDNSKDIVYVSPCSARCCVQARCHGDIATGLRLQIMPAPVGQGYSLRSTQDILAEKGSKHRMNGGTEKRKSGAEKRKSGVERRKSGAEKRKKGVQRREKRGAEKRNCTLGPLYPGPLPPGHLPPGTDNPWTDTP